MFNWCFWTVVLEKTLESPLDCKEIQPVHPKGNQSWILTGRTDAEAEVGTPILWPLIQRADSSEKTLMLERLRARREGDDRGWDDWMAWPTRWTWIWVDSGSWWWTGKPGVMQFMGLQRVGHDWVTELNWTEYMPIFFFKIFILGMLFNKYWNKDTYFKYTEIRILLYTEIRILLCILSWRIQGFHFIWKERESASCSVVSNSWQLHGL